MQPNGENHDYDAEAHAMLSDVAPGHLMSALRIGKIFIWDWNLQTNHVKRSLPAREILGIDDSHIDEFVTRIHPDDKEWVQIELEGVIGGNPSREIEFRFLSNSGLRWLSCQGDVHHDQAGKPERFVGLVVDVTERKLAEEQLRASKAQAEWQRRLYESVLNNTPDLAYIFDLNHRFIYANEVLLKMWGRTWDEAIGKNCLELGYEPWHAEMHNREIDHVVATKEPARGDVPFNGKFGRRIYDYIFVPIIGPNGEVEAVAGTTRDVTERKEWEEALIEARDKADQANTAKSEFLATMSHEIRTPMNAVIGLTHLLDMSSDNPARRKEFIATLKTSARQLMNLINDLLDVSRLEAKQLEIEKINFDLKEIFDDVLSLASVTANEKRIALRMTGSNLSNVAVVGDPSRLRQILMNVIGNAVKFTDDGSVEVAVGLQETNTGEVYLEVDVSDTGVGIAASKLESVFEKFVQADMSISRKYGGTGLGLSITKSFVELMGGEIRVKSEAGKGSTFTLRIPFQLTGAIPKQAPSLLNSYA